MTTILEVRDVRKVYRKRGFAKNSMDVIAVDGVSFALEQGTTFGLVGESGCGKSSLSRLIMRLADVSEGQIVFNGQDITQARGRALRETRRGMAMVFQNPYASLNPRARVGELVSGPLDIHGIGKPAERRERVRFLLDAVGLPMASAEKFPHEFSGGQRQRIAIARALALNPKLIICDEAVSALDVSIQAQILNLLKDLQETFNLTYLFISHDLSVVEHISDTIAVMRTGKIVEQGPADRVFKAPQNDYTRRLLDAIPKIGMIRHRMPSAEQNP
ncbi:ABC transporter ATP-binding protein [Agrobacterium tumefaciens]|uniref:ABC transporter ATP-binding protein n=1 Tax=Agrobacterium tumefaciens TaxID=358 RepID=UPI001AED78EE|nr:ATP-binding cassette domain-containing protein [Agrobacterium tumefaciens]